MTELDMEYRVYVQEEGKAAKFYHGKDVENAIVVSLDMQNNTFPDTELGILAREKNATADSEWVLIWRNNKLRIEIPTEYEATAAKFQKAVRRWLSLEKLDALQKLMDEVVLVDAEPVKGELIQYWSSKHRPTPSLDAKDS